MKPLGPILIASIALSLAAAAQAANPFEGRWDLTIATPAESYPSWMEVTGGGEVRIVGRVASVHPAAEVKLEGSRVSFKSSEWFGKPTNVSWDLRAAHGKLTGTQQREGGVEGRVSGVRAPPLRRKPPTSWPAPVPLLNGKDLTGWVPDNPSANHWKVRDGELVNEAAGANLRTARKFQDFKLHIEYNCPQDGNSGVYLRGRYEVQVEYEPAGTDDKFHSMGSIYGFLAPAADVSPRPGQWESYDITLVGRTVTVVRDGVTIIDNREIPGITGGALDSHEGQPGPLYIQGDHTGGMKYRNIRVSVAGR